jgi:hypothetical protein
MNTETIEQITEENWIVDAYAPPEPFILSQSLAVYPGASRIPVCLVTPMESRTELDTQRANLIAAAPDLLEALDALARMCVGTTVEEDNEYARALAIIRRARGE